ncbi:MAG: alanine:cation symporter family protein [Ruminococcus sp.]|nr:alanine:cation symporter family protein [Ruminococcus sp.]
MDFINQIATAVDDFLWGVPMIIILLGTHIFMTARTKFMQRKTLKAIKLSVTKDPETAGDISPFQALTTALASTIGTGNIIGVGTAIALGGAGAVLWCWLTGVFGIATKYAESLIAVKYRVKSKDGKMQGGAMYAIERGMNMKWLAVLFALFAALASFGIGCSVQTNAISNIMNNTFNSDGSLQIQLFGYDISLVSLIAGLIVAVSVALVIFGGIQSISTVCEKLVPFMAIMYVVGCIVILCFNADVLWEAICVIVKSAFSIKALGGGLMGTGIMMAARFGVARGLFSNESGMGSAPIVASAAQSRNSVRQAMISSTGTFWDTVVVCLMTGIVIVSSCIKNPDIDASTIDGDKLTSAAFAQIPVIGTPILVVGIVLFAFSTILGWSYYGERCIEYLFGKKGVKPYKFIFVLILIIAPITALDLVWTLSDIFNGLMAIPNVIAVIALSPVIVKETNYYMYGNRLEEFDKTPIPTINK